MRYLPATVIALGVAGAVGFGLYITHDIACLWGLIVMTIAYRAIPFSKDER